MKNQDTDNKEKVKKDIDVSSDLNDLVTIIVDYYCFKAEFVPEDGENWKNGTEHAPSFIVPDRIDKKIEQAFLVQLEKYIKI